MACDTTTKYMSPGKCCCKQSCKLWPFQQREGRKLTTKIPHGITYEALGSSILASSQKIKSDIQERLFSIIFSFPEHLD